MIYATRKTPPTAGSELSGSILVGVFLPVQHGIVISYFALEIAILVDRVSTEKKRSFNFSEILYFAPVDHVRTCKINK